MRIGKELAAKCLALADSAPPIAERISEKEFMQAVIDLAKRNGWLIFHPHDSRKSEAGYPDLHLVRGKVSMFRELKVGRNGLTGDQLVWLDALKEAGVDAGVWRPEEWPQIVETLEGKG